MCRLAHIENCECWPEDIDNSKTWPKEDSNKEHDVNIVNLTYKINENLTIGNSIIEISLQKMTILKLVFSSIMLMDWEL